MLFRQLFEPQSSTYTYLLADPETREAVLIDTVRETVDRDLEIVAQLGLKLTHVLDTHVHADHVTGAGEIRGRTGARTVVSKHAGTDCADRMVDDGELIHFGRYALEVRTTPGHTDSCVSYVTTGEAPKMAFTGDALLIRGCGRTDFQQGDSRKLYRSVTEKLFTLPDETFVYPGHDYRGRTVTTIGEERTLNPRLAGKTEPEFVEIMAALKLAEPKQMKVAVPLNLRCGLEVQAAPEPWAPITRAASGVPEVLADWVAMHRDLFRLVDVREVEELVPPMAKIAEAEHAPLGQLGRHAAAWPKDAPIVVVCRSGGRSGRAALELEQLGFTRVASMRGGMLAWLDKRLDRS